jgi:hypothetical protein
MRAEPSWHPAAKINLILSLSKDEAAAAPADIADQIRQPIRDQRFFHKLTAGEGLWPA